MSIFSSLQIILESLPVSSSGHLELISVRISEKLEYFMHFPTVLIILFFFRKDVFFYAQNFTKKLKSIVRFLLIIFFADSVTAFVYLTLKNLNIKNFPLWVGFLVTAVSLISLGYAHQRNQPKNVKLESIPPTKAFLVGLLQGVAFLPGVSRFGLTYSAGVWLGLKPKDSFALSFAAATPLFLAGSLKGFTGLYLSGNFSEIFSFAWIFSIIFMSVAAYFLFAWVNHLARVKKLWYFGVYMILPTLISFFISFT